MKQKSLYFILIVLFFSAIASAFLYPTYTNILGVSIILLSLAISLYSIFQKHKDTQNARAKISKETIQFVITLLLILFFAGLAGLFVNAYVSPIYGLGIGLVCTLLISFGVGYVIKWELGRLTG